MAPSGSGRLFACPDINALRSVSAALSMDPIEKGRTLRGEARGPAGRVDGVLGALLRRDADDIGYFAATRTFAADTAKLLESVNKLRCVRDFSVVELAR